MSQEQKCQSTPELICSSKIRKINKNNKHGHCQQTLVSGLLTCKVNGICAGLDKKNKINAPKMLLKNGLFKSIIFFA